MNFLSRIFPPLALGSALLGEEEEILVKEVLRSGNLFRYYGKDPACPPQMAARLEAEFVQMMAARFALAVTSGTAALEVALGALNIGPGDEVIVPAWSWISCYTAIMRLGGTPIMAEIDDTLCLAAGEIARLATPRTKAVIIVHYQGVAADLDPLLKEAKERGIYVIEDCAESPGASYRGQSVGTLGDIGTYSFQYHKSMTAGEGGMLVMNDPLLYERAVRMHDIGQYRPHHQKILSPQEKSFAGSQFRMSELTAAVALAQLRKLDGLRAKCRSLGGIIVNGLKDLPYLKLRRIVDSKGDSGFETYFFVDSEELAIRFRAKLKNYGICTTQTTGTACHYTKDYCSSGSAAEFPRTENLIRRFIALPIGVLFSEEDVHFIVSAVKRVHNEIFGEIS